MPGVLALLIVSSLAHAPATAAAGDTARCRAAADFLRETQRMVVAIDPDTLDDWRTRSRLVGCRVTAAGATRDGVAHEAIRFYERLRAAGWTRTPDPRDAPNEASLRFRRDGTDCLFNVYEVARLFTDAEFRVNEGVHPAAGESRYQALVQCAPALPAVER